MYALISLPVTFVRRAMTHTKYIALHTAKKTLDKHGNVSGLCLLWEYTQRTGVRPIEQSCTSLNSRHKDLFYDQCGLQIKVP